MTAPHDIEFDYYRKLLIEEIKKKAAKRDIDYSWQNNKVFNKYINLLKDGLPSRVPNNGDDWRKDTVFELGNGEKKRIIEKLNEGEDKMITATEIAVAAGVLLVIGIVLSAHRCSKSKTENTRFIGFSQGKVESLNSNKPKQETSYSPQSTQKTTPNYGQYELLLIIEAKRLGKNLKLGSFSSLSKEDAETIISNAMFAYCFAENDLQGKTVLKAVELSKDEGINYESEDKIFLQLSLFATPKIAEGKPDKLVIREAMHPSQGVEIKTLKKLLKTRSITAFHSLV